VEVFIREEGKEVNMVATGGFFTYEDRIFRVVFKFFGKSFKPMFIHGESNLEEDILLGINSTGGEEVFRYINADEDFVVHSFTSSLSILARQDASQPILHLDEGLIAQPTYYGLRRQAANSLESLRAQEKWSCPALLCFDSNNFSYLKILYPNL